MEYGVPISPITVNPSFSDPSVTAFDNLLGVSLGGVRRYNNRDYKVLTNVYPLATYSWNDPQSGTTPLCIRLSDKAGMPPTAVPCISNQTIVYIIDTYKDAVTPKVAVGKYFMFTGTSGNIDFTNVNPWDTYQFTQVVNFRHTDIYPDVNPLYWEDLGAVNSLKLLDGVVANATVSPVQASMTYTFTFNTAVNAVAFFGMANAQSVTVTQYRWNALTSAYDIQTFTDTFLLKALDDVYDSYTWHFTPVGQFKDRLLVRLPVWTKAKLVVTWEGDYPAVGECIFARLRTVGDTLDRPTGTRKTFAQTQVSWDGKRTVKRYNTIKDEISYRVAIPTHLADSTIKMIGLLLESNLLIVGDESGEFTTLINYGYISDLPFEIPTGNTITVYGITVNTLV
jgi:hypothetical protein